MNLNIKSRSHSPRPRFSPSPLLHYLPLSLAPILHFFAKASKCKLLFTLLSLVFLVSCNLFAPNTTSYDVTLELGQSYDINLGQSGDEEAAIMTIQPLHASVSETYRDTINWDVYYHYVPDSSYVGTDYVKFELAYLEQLYDSSFKTEGYIEINFTIDGTTGERLEK